MITSLLVAAVIVGQPADQFLRFESAQVVAKLPAEHAAKLPLGRLTQDQGEAVLSVAFVPPGAKTPGPAMIGKYERSGNELTFAPRFSLEPGQTYRASLTLGGKTVTLDHRVPELKNQTAPKVVKIYPTSDVLPANHLKFYIYFDRPMRGGKELFNLIELVDDKGNVIYDPWLREEIWDEENNCLIIYIHPGRIKWGIELRELLGPVLFEKRDYGLVIRGDLSDPKGNKIGKDVVKKFRTTPEDRVRIEVGDWKFSVPKAERDALTLTFPKAIDHRSLQRFLNVMDEKGNRVEGNISIGKEEKSWQFMPTRPWDMRSYHLDIDPRLEDVAGNTPARAFDFDPKSPKQLPQKLRLEFDPGANR